MANAAQDVFPRAVHRIGESVLQAALRVELQLVDGLLPAGFQQQVIAGDDVIHQVKFLGTRAEPVFTRGDCRQV